MINEYLWEDDAFHPQVTLSCGPWVAKVGFIQSTGLPTMKGALIPIPTPCILPGVSQVQHAEAVEAIDIDGESPVTQTPQGRACSMSKSGKPKHLPKRTPGPPKAMLLESSGRCKKSLRMTVPCIGIQTWQRHCQGTVIGLGKMSRRGCPELPLDWQMMGKICSGEEIFNGQGNI